MPDTTCRDVRQDVAVSRLFVGLWLPEHAHQALETLHRKDQVGARFINPDNWHITLRFLGDADPNEVADRLRSTHFAATTVRLGPAVDIGGERTLFVPVSGTDDLAARVVDSTRDLGTEAIRRTHLGHVTLARVKKRANMPRALGSLVDASWQPTEVALVESTLHPDGSRYDTLETFPIREPMRQSVSDTD